MTCFHPLTCYRLTNRKTESGKSQIVFDKKLLTHEPYVTIRLKCNQCIGCRIDHSRDWAVRCYHEASLYNYNCFITLTFDEENIPDNRSLDKKDFKNFMKRLRKNESGFDPVFQDGKRTYPIRFFHCGEYGDDFQRPHHHACIFNFDFLDKEIYQERENVKIYTSQYLQKLWPYGFSTVGEVTYDSAAYIARYIFKKINGERKEAHYARVNRATGEVTQVEQEHITMSRRPGIGKRWFDKFSTDVYPKDFITIKGKKFRPPTYYDNLLAKTDPEMLRIIKSRRTKSEIYSDQNEKTIRRLLTKKKCLESKTKRLVRKLEND